MNSAGGMPKRSTAGCRHSLSQTEYMQKYRSHLKRRSAVFYWAVIQLIEIDRMHLSEGCDAAVQYELGTCCICGVIRRKEYDQIGNFPDFCDSSHRNRLDELFHLRANVFLFEHRCADDARMDGVDPYVMRRQVFRSRFRHTTHREFRIRIACRTADQAID